MVEMLLASWIVRGFVLYLVVGGAAALVQRARAAEPASLAWGELPVVGDKWLHRWAAYAHLRARPDDVHLTRPAGWGDYRFS